MNDTMTIQLEGGQTKTIDFTGCTTAEDYNARLAEHGMAAMVRALTPAELREATAKRAAEWKAGLLKTIRGYGADDIAAGLRHIGRKGWGLDGMAVAKLEELVACLVDEPDDY